MDDEAARSDPEASGGSGAEPVDDMEKTKSGSSATEATGRRKKSRTATLPDQCLFYADVVTLGVFSDAPIDSAHHASLKLGIPGPDEECPVTLEKMAESYLDFLPGVTYLKDSPKHRKITLACDHSFSAMAIMYHFVKNNMQCPLCREGHKDTLSARCIPKHFKAQLLSHLRRIAAKDREETERENFEAVMRIAAAEVGVPMLSDLLHVYAFTFWVYAYASSSDPSPGLVMEFPSSVSLDGAVGWTGSGSFTSNTRQPAPPGTTSSSSLSPPVDIRVVRGEQGPVLLGQVPPPGEDSRGQTSIPSQSPDPRDSGGLGTSIRVTLPDVMLRRLQSTMVALDGFSCFQFGVGARNVAQGIVGRSSFLVNTTPILDMSSLRNGPNRFEVIGQNMLGYFELTVRSDAFATRVDHLCWVVKYQDFMSTIT